MSACLKPLLFAAWLIPHSVQPLFVSHSAWRSAPGSAPARGSRRRPPAAAGPPAASAAAGRSGSPPGNDVPRNAKLSAIFNARHMPNNKLKFTNGWGWECGDVSVYMCVLCVCVGKVGGRWEMTCQGTRLECGWGGRDGCGCGNMDQNLRFAPPG